MTSRGLFSFLSPGILLAYFSLASLGFGDNVRGPLFPEILRAFELQDFHGSWMFALSAFFSMLGGLSSSWFFRRWDRVVVLDFCLLLMSVSLGACALAFSYEALLAASAGFGFSLGLMGVCQNALVAATAADHHRQRILAGMHAMYGLSSLLAPLLVVFAVAWSGSWRFPFALVAVLPFAVALWSRRFVHRGDLDMEARASARRAFPFLPSLVMGLMIASYVVTEIVMASRLALYMRRAEGADLTGSSLAVTLFFVGLMAGRLLSALIRWPLSLRTQMLVSLLASLAALGAGLGGFSAGFVISGLTLAPFYPTAVAFVAERLPGRVDFTLGLTMGLQSALIVLMHLGAGWISENLSIQAAMALAPLSLASSLFFLGIYEFVFRRDSARL